MKRAVIRLPSEVVDRLDRLAEELRVAHPDEAYSRASLARALISGGLALAERAQEGLVGVAGLVRLVDLPRRGARTAARRAAPPAPPARQPSGANGHSTHDVR